MHHSSVDIEIVRDPGQPGVERRRSPRRRMRNSAVLKFMHGEQLWCTTIEMSMGGISVMASRQLKVGTQCVLEFDLYCNGSNVRIVGVGKVVNCSCSGLDGFRVGMLFAISDQRAQQHVVEFLK
jgi:hypothetical protein